MTIKQEDKNGCGIACLAMWLDMKYDGVRSQYFDDGRFEEKGLTDWDMWRVFSFHHVPVKKWKWSSIDELEGWKAILTVKSINQKNAWHYVYWDGAELHDPSPGKTYTVDMLDSICASSDHIVETTYGITADFDTLMKNFSWQRAFEILEKQQPARYEDDTALGRLQVLFDDNNDAHLTIVPDPDESDRRSVRFCTATGGGTSRRVRTALMLLALAMIKDNRDDPQQRGN